MRVEPILKCVEFTLVPLKTPREIVCGFQRDELVVCAEVDRSVIDTLPVKLVVELNVADVTDRMQVRVALVADWVAGVQATDHHALGGEDGQNEVGGVLVKFRAGTLAVIFPPVCSGGELRPERFRNVVKLEWEKACLDNGAKLVQEGLQFRAVLNSRTRFGPVLWGGEIEMYYGEARATERKEQSGNRNGSLHVSISGSWN